jgi:hypothetical protein
LRALVAALGGFSVTLVLPRVVVLLVLAMVVEVSG